MIIISADTETFVPFTLYEKTTLQNCDYILDLYSNQNHNHTYLWLTGDTSNNNMRYNYFPINTTGLDLIGGTYDYFVYQTTGNTLSTTGLTINDIVETGLCKIISLSGNTDNTFDNNQDEYTFV